MKKIFLLILLMIPILLVAQNRPYGSRIRNNFYQVKGHDTTWYQLNDTALFYNSDNRMKFNDTLFMVSVAEGQRAVDSFVLVLDQDGRVSYLPIDSVGSSGGGFDSIYVEGVVWVKNLDTIPTTELLTVDITEALLDTLNVDVLASAGNADSTTYLIKPPHIYMGYQDSAVLLPGALNTWYVITNTANTLYTVDEDDWSMIRNDSIFITVAGDYVLQASFSFSGNNGEAWQVGFHKDGTIMNHPSTRYTSNNDVGNMTILVYGECEVGDAITLEIRNISDNDDPTAISSSVFMYRLHP